MAGIAVVRRSFLRKCELVEETVGDTVYSYFESFEPPEILAQTGDLAHYVQTGDRPDTIANRYYGTPHLWWVVALANDMDDPVSGLYLGRKLTIPNPRYVLETVTS